MGAAQNEETNISEYEHDKLQKQSLVLKTLAKHCSLSSPHEDIRGIAAALQDGGDMQITNISGGYTNYTYKVSVGSTAVFAKLCFPRAFWNPDPDCHYDTSRIASEKEMMELFGRLAPGCVAVPYLLIDLENEMKLLVAEWAPADEQLANQFIDGVPDIRIAKGLARSIALLHSTDMDPSFNTDARECFLDLHPALIESLVNLAASTNNKYRRAADLAKELGPNGCAELFDQAAKDYRSQQILGHTDLHAFNCLVESRPSRNAPDDDTDSSAEITVFGEKGSFFVCDWEMAMVGPLGVDTGRVFSIPVDCMIAHSVNGTNDDGKVVADLMNWVNTYWETYAEGMASKFGDDDTFLARSFRNSLGWLGWKLFATSVHHWFVPFFNLEQQTDLDKFLESIKILGIKFMRWGFTGYEPDLTLEELRSRFEDAVNSEVSIILASRTFAAAPTKRRRKSSMLGETSRRVSDAFQNFPSSEFFPTDLEGLALE